MISDDLSVGISVFGNGGLNTSYGSFGHPFSFFACGQDPQNPLPTCGTEVGIDLIQLYIAPTVSYKVNERFSVGASLNLIAQSFEAKGLYAFLPFSSDPTAFTNNNHDNSYGASLRLGLMYEINDRVTLGATYQTKGWMREFDDYAGLFADGGDFDIPQNYGIGIAVKATDKLDIAMDILRIDYGSINAIGNSPNIQKPFGADDGPGFGWEDQTIIKIGAAYQYNSALTLRAGYNYGTNPVKKHNGFNGAFGPGVGVRVRDGRQVGPGDLRLQQVGADQQSAGLEDQVRQGHPRPVVDRHGILDLAGDVDLRPVIRIPPGENLEDILSLKGHRRHGSGQDVRQRYG